MAFTGKATYDAGATLPELAEDVADLVRMISPFDTPLLEALGDPTHEAQSTHHQWTDDALLANTDPLAEDLDAAETDVTVTDASVFRIGDQIQVEGKTETMLVTAVNTTTQVLTVTRGYGGTAEQTALTGATVRILGNAALEGDDAPSARFTTRTRTSNYTQIFTATVEVSGSDAAARQGGGIDEFEWQKYCRLAEQMRQLECTVIGGRQPETTPQGSSTVRRTMQGIIPFLSTHVYATGGAGLPAGTALTEAMLNYILRQIWETSGARVDLLVMGGYQKRKLNLFCTSQRSYDAADRRAGELVQVYESDFGQCRAVLTRWVPPDTVLFLDSSRIQVLPLRGRSFHFQPLATTGDRQAGLIVGEYTVELRNEAAHGLLRGLDVADV